MSYFCVIIQTSKQLIEMKTSSNFNGSQTIQKVVITNQSTLLEILQSIFDDITIYNDPHIRKLITSSPKGFVSIDQIMNLPVFLEFQNKNPHVFVTPDQICRCIIAQSKKLVAVNYRLKRIQPFVDKIKNKELKAVYIDRLPNKSTDEIYQFFKNIVGVVYKIYHKRCEKWTIIIIDDYEPLLQMKNSLYFDDNKLNVQSPMQTLISYGENERLTSEFNILRLYENKVMFENINFHLDDSDNEEKERIYQKRIEKYKHGQSYEKYKQHRFEQNERQQDRYSSHFDSEQMKNKARAKQNQRNAKRDMERVMNFDNSRILALRPGPKADSMYD